MYSRKNVGLLLLALTRCALFTANAQTDPVPSAITALEQGDVATAEKLLRQELRAHPADVPALDVLGVVLDKEGKLAEADVVYRRAVSFPHPSAGLLNNFGNHLLAAGKLNEARSAFERVLALDPSYANAHTQLARLLLKQAPPSALEHLNQLSPEAQQTSDAELLRMQALFALHRDTEAEALLAQIEMQTSGNPHAAVQLRQALMAAGHIERARQILQNALNGQPRNPDLLFELALVDIKLNQKETALKELVQAEQLAPDRADIEALLARTTADLGYYGDAADAWERYTKLAPEDDAGRRERGFMQSALGLKPALDDLRWFTAKHPVDPTGHYELGIALSTNEPAEALVQFNRTLVLQPDFVPALVARALLNYRQGKPAAALPDLELANNRQANNPRILDRLGQTYLALDKSAQAVESLRRAAERAPRDPSVLLHFSHALNKAGDKQEASAVMARFRELGPNRTNLAHESGLVSFLSLSPEEQWAQYRAGVERTVRSNPGNAAAQVQYLKLLLDDGQNGQAAVVSRQILALAPALALLADSADALLRARQYALAKTFIEQAIPLTGSVGNLGLDGAIATLHVDNPRAALERMDHLPSAGRNANYYLAHIDMLNAAGRSAETAADVIQALKLAGDRPELYSRAILSLTENKRFTDASQLAGQAAQHFPNDPEVLLTNAIVREATGKTVEAETSLRQIEDRWPDWPEAWLVHALLLDSHQHIEEANRMLDIAGALGDPRADIVRRRPPSSTKLPDLVQMVL